MKNHEMRLTPRGVEILSNNGVKVYLSRSGYTKIMDGQYSSPAQAIAHVARMFEAAEKALKEEPVDAPNLEKVTGGTEGTTETARSGKIA
jgi:hypothetical protein